MCKVVINPLQIIEIDYGQLCLQDQGKPIGQGSEARQPLPRGPGREGASGRSQEMRVVWNGLEFRTKSREASGEGDGSRSWGTGDEAGKLGQGLEDPDRLLAKAVQGFWTRG